MKLSRRKTIALGIVVVILVSFGMLSSLALVPHSGPHGLPGLMVLFGVAFFLPGALVAVVSGVLVGFRIAAHPIGHPISDESSGLRAAIGILGLGTAVAVFGLVLYSVEFLSSQGGLLRMGVAMVIGGGLACLGAATMVSRGRAGQPWNIRRPAGFYLWVGTVVLGAIVAGLPLFLLCMLISS